MDFADESAEDKQIFRDTRTKLRDYIKELPVEQKQVLIMRHYLQMSFQEIAERTDVSINTALGRMRYALINLRKKMVKHRAYDTNFYPNGPDQVFIPRDYGGGEQEN
jgi:RNA polymerase sigma-70 factor (ECF subfamily)